MSIAIIAMNLTRLHSIRQSTNSLLTQLADPDTGQRREASQNDEQKEESLNQEEKGQDQGFVNPVYSNE